MGSFCVSPLNAFSSAHPKSGKRSAQSVLPQLLVEVCLLRKALPQAVASERWFCRQPWNQPSFSLASGPCGGARELSPALPELRIAGVIQL